MSLLLLYAPPGGPPTGVLTAELLVEMAFGYDASAATPVFTDISSYVRSCRWERGRQNEINQTQAGIGSLLLKDADSAFDPRNALSPFYPNVKPDTPVRGRIRIVGTGGGVDYFPLFRMVTERQPRTLKVTDAYTERQIDMVDGFALLAKAGLGGYSYSAELSDVRVGNVLDDIGWPAALRSIGTGVSTIEADAFAASDDTRAQSHLLAVNDSENGFIFCDGPGDLVFVGRHELIQDSAYTVSQATFRDGRGSSGYPYTEIVPSYDIDQAFQRWTGERSGGVPQVADDGSAFPRTKQITSLVTTDVEVLEQVQWKLAQFGEPLNRVESITVMPFKDDQDEAQIRAGLDREIADRITVLETPPGFSAEQSDDYVIQHLEGMISPGPLSSMKLKYLLWPASTQEFWIAGDANLSLAGVSTRAAY